MSNIQEIIAEFGRSIGLDGLALDEGNCCTLQFDAQVVTIEYLPDSDELYFYTRVGIVPAHEATRLRLFTFLLEADCFFRRTSGGVLGVDMEREAVVYTNKVGVGGWLNANLLGEYMQAFVNLAEEFARQLRDIDAQAPEAGGAAPEPSGMALRV
jgi:hypothetical protein